MRPLCRSAGFQTIENDRVMADDHLDAVFDGIIDGPHHDVQGDHELIDRFVRAADEQARIIPTRFFERQRRPSFQYFDDFTYCSCHFNSSRSAIRFLFFHPFVHIFSALLQAFQDVPFVS